METPAIAQEEGLFDAIRNNPSGTEVKHQERRRAFRSLCETVRYVKAKSENTIEIFNTRIKATESFMFVPAKKLEA